MLRKIICASLLLSACNGEARETTAKEPAREAPAKERSLSEQFLAPDARTNALVDSIYNSLSDTERAAQMIMTASSPSEKLGYPFATARKMVAGDVAANVVFLKGTSGGFKAEAEELNQLKKGKLRPLLACDCEPTLLPGKWTDVTGIQPASEQKDAAAVAANTGKINAILKKVGIQLNFAPVVDIAINKSVINKRSFGADPAAIASLSRQFVQTTQEGGIGATLKHFPGHGAVTGDTHKQSVYIDGELTELATFKKILQAEESPVAVMVGHIIVRNNARYSTDGLPSTLSRTIITDLLRKELRFNGIITTDALNMEAAAKVPDADWKSVLAGVDLVLMPKNAAALNTRIAAALAQRNELSRQLEASVKRIIRFKVISRI